MTLSLPAPGPRLGSIGAIGLALTWTAVSFGAALTPAPAMAQNPSKAYYRAELAQPAAQPRAIAGDLVWACNGTSCVADKGTSRPLRICREVNRKFGEVVSFTTKGETLPAEDLEKCNG
ncbi:MAG: hypothetical protein K2Y17_10365 [Qipengyuania sp.]|nr:hypothetical protein [Qipengyuania sp.]